MIGKQTSLPQSSLRDELPISSAELKMVTLKHFTDWKKACGRIYTCAGFIRQTEEDVSLHKQKISS
jgi:hypothetical protein